VLSVLQRVPPSRGKGPAPAAPPSSRRRGAAHAALLWADKHAPGSVADLAVAKKARVLFTDPGVEHSSRPR
jgi:hypothetical protein